MNASAADGRRRQRRIVYAAVGLYVAAFACWWPNALIVSDEAAYVGQATLFSEGRVATNVWGPTEGRWRLQPVSWYPAGTSLVQSAFVRAGGWRAAALASLLSAVGMVLLLVAWLERTGRAPIFALLALLYPPVTVLARVGTSDVQSGFVVTAGLLLFWLGLEGRRWAWLAAGFVAGASLLWRETNALMFVPLFVGAFVRRESRVWQLVAGGLAGVGLRLGMSALVFGQALFSRYPHGWGAFHPVHPVREVLLYLFALTVMVPGGLPALALYRGARRVEIIATVALMFVFYSCYYYDGRWSMLPMQLILAPRFFIVVVPVLVFVLADVVPRLPRPSVGVLRKAGLVAGLAAAAELVAVHPILYAWGRRQLRMRDALYATTPPNAYVIINPDGVGKMISYAYGQRRWVPRFATSPARVASWATAPDKVFLAFINRSDTPARVGDARENARFEQEFSRMCTLHVARDEQVSSFEHLRIVEVERCSATARAGGA